MSRNSASGEVRKRTAKKGAPSGGDRTIVLILAAFTALAIAAIAVIAVLSSSGSGSSGNFTPNNQGLLKVGSQAPDFTINTVNGGSASLKGSNEATMLVFFATWCPHCNREAPILSDISKNYSNLRVMMISVPQKKTGWEAGDSPQKVREFVNHYDIKGPAAYNPALGERYKVTGTPTIYILNKNDKIVAANTGEVPEDVLKGWIQKAL